MAVAVVAVCLFSRVFGQTNLSTFMSSPILAAGSESFVARKSVVPVVAKGSEIGSTLTNLSISMVKPPKAETSPIGRKVDLAEYERAPKSAWDNLYYAHQQEIRGQNLEEADLFGKVFQFGKTTVVFPGCLWQNPAFSKERVTIGGFVFWKLQ